MFSKKTMFRTLFLVVVFAMALSACGPAEVATEAPVVVTDVPATAEMALVTSSGYVVPAAACAPNCTYADMVVGFIQTGPEGAWRTANNASFDEAATQLGIELKVYDSQGKVENQISAFHTFNQDPTVNVILIAAVDTTGFDDVLQEAAENGKLVILEDRSLNSSAELYYTRIGSDFTLEGQRAGPEMCKLLEGFDKKNVVEISGAVGASAATERAAGFRQTMGECGITITASQTGDWKVAPAKAVMEAWLKDPVLSDIQGVFTHNIEEALGAIQAIKDAGLVPGVDIMVVTFDTTKDTFTALIAGELGAAVECNPLLGPQVYEVALQGLNGDTTIPSYIPSQEGIFTADQGPAALQAILDGWKY
jgi:galactofuranose transport system substrate-binding protein